MHWIPAREWWSAVTDLSEISEELSPQSVSPMQRIMRKEAIILTYLNLLYSNCSWALKGSLHNFNRNPMTEMLCAYGNARAVCRPVFRCAKQKLWQNSVYTIFRTTPRLFGEMYGPRYGKRTSNQRSPCYQANWCGKQFGSVLLISFYCPEFMR